MKRSRAKCHILAKTNRDKTDKYELDGREIIITTNTTFVGVKETNEGGAE